MRVFKFAVLLLLAFSATAWFAPRSDDQQIYDAMDTLAEVLVLARTNASDDVSSQDLVEGAVEGLLSQLDPHSSYYNRARYQTMREDQNGAFFGIGVIVGYQNERLTVVTALQDAPAARAGIKAGDVIVQIDQVEVQELGVGGAEIDQSHGRFSYAALLGCSGARPCISR